MAQQWEQIGQSFLYDIVSKTVLEGSSPSTPANKKPLISRDISGFYFFAFLLISLYLLLFFLLFTVKSTVKKDYLCLNYR